MARKEDCTDTKKIEIALTLSGGGYLLYKICLISKAVFCLMVDVLYIMYQGKMLW